MREYLPPDDEKTRKNPLYRNLYEEFDKIDGRPARGRLSRPMQGSIPPPSRRAGPNHVQQSEIEALQAKINELRRQEAGEYSPLAINRTEPILIIHVIYNFIRMCFCAPVSIRTLSVDLLGS